MSLLAANLAAPVWNCVHFTSQAPDSDALAAAGIDPRSLDASQISGGSALLAALSEALEFPDYFGQNWDATDDCLRDLGWLGTHEGLVLVVTGAGNLWRSDPRSAGALVESWLLAAASWGDRDRAFHLVFEW